MRCKMPKGEGDKGKKASGKPLDLSKYEIVHWTNAFNGNKEEEKECLDNYFREQAKKLFPHLCKETYQVPDVHFNKGKTVKPPPSHPRKQKTPDTPSEKFKYQEKIGMLDGDARGDRAHAKVLTALKRLSENLRTQGFCPLFIINSYHNDSYLQRLIQDNMPGDLGYWKGRGEMDMLILKPDLVVFVEAKSTGDNVAEWGEGSAVKTIAIGKKVKSAFKQLDSYEDVFNTCMEESLQQNIKSKQRIAAFPNLKLQDIKDIAEKQPDILSQDDIGGRKYKLLCSDTLESVETLTQWWRQNIETTEPLKLLDDFAECDQPSDVKGLREMQIIIGRYLGEMSVVNICNGSQTSRCREVRRKGQSINVTGDEFSMIILTKDQVDFVNNNVRLGYLNGPPGSGKTVVLAIRGRRWIVEDDGITIVLNMYRGSKGRSIGKQTRNIICDHKYKHKLLENCIEMPIDVDQFGTMERAAFKNDMLTLSKDTRKFLFLVDETYVTHYWLNVFNMLIEDFADSHIWLAGLYGGKPDNFENMTLTEVMRCPPNVQKVLYEVDWIEERKITYRLDSTMADMPTDGTDVMVLLHRYHQEPHLHPAQCRDCGEDLVTFLEKTLDVKKPDSQQERPLDLRENSLKCSDVVILVNLPRNLYKDDKDYLDTNEHCYTEYMKLIASSSLVKALNNNGFPTKVHTTLPCCELVPSPEEEVIHISWIFSYQGLENKVIIFLPAGPAMPKEDVLDKFPENEHALWVDPSKNIPCPGLIGRCAGQWDEHVKFNPNIAFQNTEVEKAADPDSDNNCGVAGGMCRERSSSLTPPKDTIRTWRKKDLQRYCRWDKSTLFISASRCTAQLFLITP